jgi:S1-C subfamily serine protease
MSGNGAIVSPAQKGSFRRRDNIWRVKGREIIRERDDPVLALLPDTLDRLENVRVVDVGRTHHATKELEQATSEWRISG